MEVDLTCSTLPVHQVAIVGLWLPSKISRLHQYSFNIYYTKQPLLIVVNDFFSRMFINGQ
jgi:hypothetical protein